MSVDPRFSLNREREREIQREQREEGGGAASPASWRVQWSLWWCEKLVHTHAAVVQTVSASSTEKHFFSNCIRSIRVTSSVEGNVVRGTKSY